MYLFKDKKDQIGLPMESIIYVKKNCNECYGKGYITSLIGDGYILNETKLKVKNDVMDTYPCLCMHKGYARTRLKLEAQIESICGGNDTTKDEIMKNVIDNYLKSFEV